MLLSDYIPFTRSPVSMATIDEARASTVTPETKRAVVKLFKNSAVALGLSGFTSLSSRTTFEVAPYDLVQIDNAVDTDSFLKQGLAKYRELMWKEQWDISSENDEAADYIRERIDFMEMAMQKPFQAFLNDVGDQLIKFGNVFIAKSRGDLEDYFPSNIKPINAPAPVVGYYIIPAETVEIQRNRNNKVVAYRQRLDDAAGLHTNSKQPRWMARDVIHLSLDKKPGRAFGTPFLVSVLDDVLSLRQIEEDILNLVHQELFPIYKYQIGTPEAPAEPEEIDQAEVELQNMRHDGGLILPERHDVDVVGAEGSTLEAAGYLEHFVNRVVVGLGLAPHHLGIMSEGGNRSVTDRLDIALYDRIKNIQRYIADMIRIAIFNELLMEGGFNPFVNPQNEGTSDRCDFVFREIDVDTQVKKENHIIQKWTSDLMEFEEVRQAFKLDQEVDEERLYSKMQAKIQEESQIAVTKAINAAQPAGSPNRNQTARRTTTNKSTPRNQHGRRSSPNIRHDDTWLNSVVETLDEQDGVEYSVEEQDIDFDV